MTSFIRWIIGLATTLILLYSIAINPQAVTLNWNLAADPIDAPLYTIILSTFLFGFLAGTLYLWLNQLPKNIANKKERKQQAKHIKQLEQDLDKQHEQNTSSSLLRD